MPTNHNNDDLPEKGAAGALIKSIDIKRFIIKTADGKTMSPLDVAQEAADLQDRGVAFSEHMFQLAAKCKSPDEFAAVCDETQHRMKWGKHPVNAPVHERSKWTGAPQIWKVYRSTIFRAWADHNIKPGKQISMTRTTDGETKTKNVKVESIYRLKALARQHKEMLHPAGPSVVPEVEPLELKSVVSELEMVWRALTTNKQKNDLIRTILDGLKAFRHELEAGE